MRFFEGNFSLFFYLIDIIVVNKNSYFPNIPPLFKVDKNNIIRNT